MSWCKFLQSPTTYKPQNLPYRRYLQNDKLKEDLKCIFEEFALQSDKLSDLGSTQANESLNNTIASKAPKAVFYSGSESNDFRVAAAVAQKNLGHQYVPKVNDAQLLSPGSQTIKRCHQVDLKRKHDKEVEDTIEYKWRRLAKKESKLKQQASSEIREGVTYMSSVDLNNNLQDVDITEIPPPVAEPELSKLSPDAYTFIYFDLETTGLSNNSEITQIAAVHGDISYDQYVIPKSRISASATCVTGLALSQDGLEMFKNGEKVCTKEIREALTEFFQWLRQFPNPVILAHNARFDARILCHTILSEGSDSGSPICGFIDTLDIFRCKLPGRVSYKQIDLAKDVITVHYNAHDAVADARVLQKLVKATGISETELLDSSFNFQSYMQKLKYNIMKDKNSVSLQHLVLDKVVSKITQGKIASSGLSYDHSKLAHQRDPFTGIKSLFSEKFHGKPRVTNNSKIICKIFSHFST